MINEATAMQSIRRQRRSHDVRLDLDAAWGILYTLTGILADFHSMDTRPLRYEPLTGIFTRIGELKLPTDLLPAIDDAALVVAKLQMEYAEAVAREQEYDPPAMTLR